MKTALRERILIIDDSEDNHTLLRTYFEAYGIHSYSAYDGEEALTLLRELCTLPRVILLDNQMPKMDGSEFRRRQMADRRLRDIPVFMISAEISIINAPDMVEPQRIFTKPIDIDELMEAVAAQIEDSTPSDTGEIAIPKAEGSKEKSRKSDSRVRH